MDNRKQSSNQMLRILLLTFCAYMLFQNYFGPKPEQQTGGRDTQKAPSLALAFAGIAPIADSSTATSSTEADAANSTSATSTSTNSASTNAENAKTSNSVSPAISNSASNSATPAGEPVVGEAPNPKMAQLNARTGAAEITKLEKAITANPNDEYSYWARLRKGLIQQYILGKLEFKPRPRGAFDFISSIFAPQPDSISIYDEIGYKMGTDAVSAQAAYQNGDYRWRSAMANGGVPTRDAALALQQVIHRGRGSSPFLETPIYVPVSDNVPLDAPPPGGFKTVKVGQLHSIIEKVNAYYSTTTFYKIVDTVVRAFGNNPKFSYGLAILFFAVLTRAALQPIMKKQYESMKGMQLIAPEMKKIQEKYKNKPDKQADMVQEIRALQANHGVNPMMGCGLALIQIPFFVFVVYPMIQHYESKMELESASFLWIANLVRPDIALLIMYAFSMFLSMRLSSTPPTDPQQAQMQAIMTYAMPLTIPFFLHSYPSAFTMFWMVYNFVSTILQYRMMKAGDPTKTVWKALMGAPAPVAAGAEAVPPRPKNPNKPVVTKTLAPTVKPDNRVAKNGKPLHGTPKNGTATQSSSAAQTESALESDEVADESPDAFENAGVSSAGATNAGASDKNGASNSSARSSRRARQRRRH